MWTLYLCVSDVSEEESNFGDSGYPDVDDEFEGMFNVYFGRWGMLSP
jgi:hypothetical protein